ncbi:MAG: hypothetical protein ACFFAE_03755 [Candidatus Hodarchaeota archaeon]
MIKTEKKAVDVKEFSRTEPIYRENVIRHLVRLASSIVISLLGISVVQYYFPDLEVYKNIMSPMLIFALMIVFLIGLVLAFFQLRWVNKERNKSTNFGGIVGFFGVLLTLISSLSSAIAIPLEVLIPLFGLGLLLTLIGFFAETTRIDEPLVFWFKMNLEVIIRYTISIIGVFLINWSLLSIIVLFLVDQGVITILVFPGDLTGGLMIGGIGGGLVWGSWFHKINQTIYRYRVEIIRTTELSISQGLILVALIIPFLDLSPPTTLSLIFGITGLAVFYLDLYIFKVKVTSHFSKGFVTLSQVIAFMIGCFLIIIGIIQTLIHSMPDWFFFSLYFPLTGLLLLYRVWFDNINHTVKRSVQTIVWFFRTYYREVVTTIGFCLMVLGSFLIELTKMINPLLIEFLMIDSFFDPLPLGLFLGGFTVGVVIWYIPDRHAYFRGVTTIMSVIVVLWGFLLLSSLLRTSTSDVPPYMISTILIVLGIGVDGWIWRIEIQTFLKTYYREIITMGALGFMVFGLFTWNNVINFPHWPFLFFFIGYMVGVVVWRIPDRHDYFRGVTTALSTTLVLFGVFLLFFLDYQSINWLSGGLVVIGVVVNGMVWRKELKHLVIQITVTIKNALIQTGQTIKNSLIAVKDAFIQATHAFIQFVDKTLYTIWDHRIAIVRVFMTIVGFVSIIVSILTWFGFYIAFLTWSLGLESFLFITGVLILYLAWFHQINRFMKQSTITIWNTLVKTGHALYNFLREVKNAVIEALHTIWLYRIVILRVLATIIGPLVMLTAIIVVPGITIVAAVRMMLFIVGIAILYVTWIHQINYFIKQLNIAIRDAIVQSAHAIYNFLVAAKNTIVTIFQYTWDHRIDILRAITTTIGFILVLTGLFPIIELIDFNIRVVLILGGIILLYLAWRQHINQFVKQSAIAIHNTLIQTARAIKNFFVAIKDAIIHLVRASVQFLQTYYIEIIRYFSTCIGILFLIIGFVTILQDPIGWLLIGGGISILYIAWLHQVNRFIKQTLQAIKDAIVHAAHAFGSFMRKIGIQLNQLFRTTIDLTIPIILVLLAISVLFYGFIVLISGLIDPSGVQMSELSFSIPILGPILNVIAAVIQGEAYSENILGVFANQLFLIPLGAALIVIGGIIFLFVALKKEAMRLQTLRNPKDSYDSSKGDE